MGVFVPVSPFQAMRLTDDLLISSAQQLFLIGGLAIAIGVFTYSKRVMMTVGSELMRLTPWLPGLLSWLIPSCSFFLPPNNWNNGSPA